MTHPRTSEPPIGFLSVDFKRARIGFIAFTWTLMGLSNFEITDRVDRWQPRTLAMFFFVAAVAMVVFIFRPCRVWAWRMAGGLSVVAMAARLFAIIGGELQVGGESLGWFLAAQITWNLVFLVVFWWFWNNEVRSWHVYCARRRYRRITS